MQDTGRREIPDIGRMSLKASAGIVMAFFALVGFFLVADVVEHAWRGDLRWIGVFGLVVELAILALGGYVAFLVLKSYDRLRDLPRRIAARLSR